MDIKEYSKVLKLLNYSLVSWFIDKNSDITVNTPRLTKHTIFKHIVSLLAIKPAISGPFSQNKFIL